MEAFQNDVGPTFAYVPARPAVYTFGTMKRVTVHLKGAASKDVLVIGEKIEETDADLVIQDKKGEVVAKYGKKSVAGWSVEDLSDRLVEVEDAPFMAPTNERPDTR